MSRKIIQTTLILLTGLGLVGGMALFQGGMFSGEPMAAGHPLNYWLNHITCFREIEIESFLPVPVRENPSEDKRALNAIVSMGSGAGPILLRFLATPLANPSSKTTPIKEWLTDHGLAAPVRPFGNEVVEQIAFHQSAGLALLALGSEHGGGVKALLEAWEASPSKSFVPQVCFLKAKKLLPERIEEIRRDLLAAMKSTNVEIRLAAVKSATQFQDNR